MSNHEEVAVLNWIELWKAIHGGCWPGPPIDQRLTDAAREVLVSLSLLDSSRNIADKQLAKGLASYAVGRFNTAAKTVSAFGG